jgi:arsenite methyltransferase
MDWTWRARCWRSRARTSKGRAATNVEFLKGKTEAIPLPEQTVDVVSNCVINLSADKDAALRETVRVLKPDRRFAVSDVVLRGDVPAEIRRSMELWVECAVGALHEQQYKSKLQAAGFIDVGYSPGVLRDRGRAHFP